jgi:cytochrome c-type biogenesis protein CcmH
MDQKKNALLMVLFLSLLSSILILSVRTVSAQQPTPSDDQVNTIARQLYCPVCENTPLDVCPTTACHQWRELIRQMLAEGKSAADIKQYFVDYYGARVLAEPPVSGINWLVYIVPPVAFLAGVFLLFQAFRTWKKSPRRPEAGTIAPSPDAPENPSATPSMDDKYINRLEEELKKRK